jgi:hypothetical protein
LPLQTNPTVVIQSADATSEDERLLLQHSGVFKDGEQSDLAPNVLHIVGQSAYAQASSNKTGANIRLAAGMGSKVVQVADWNNCSGDTVTITVNGVDYVRTEGVNWVAATSNNATATSLGNAVNNITGVTSAVVTDTVYATLDTGFASVKLATNDATCLTVTNNTDGDIDVFSFMDMNSKGLYSSSGAVILGTSGPSGHGLSNGDTVNGADFEVNGKTYLDDATEIAGVALTSGGTDDYTLQITQTLNDSGAAGGSDVYRGLKLNVTQTDVTGWDSVYLMDLQTDGTSRLQVDDDGGHYYDSSGNALYWCEEHVGAGKATAGGSGATYTVWNTATDGWLLDATTEYLYLDATDIEGFWDSASDIQVNVIVALNAAETANDIINGEVVSEYFSYLDNSDNMDSPKTQTRTINHDIGSDNAQGDTG